MRFNLIVQGAAAGAAGTTALNAVTYLDMTLRGRDGSSTPQDTVERLAGKINVTIAGDDQQRSNRVSGLGSLFGLAAGTGVGAGLGVARAAGWRPSPAAGALTAAAVALIAANAPMKVLGVTDPQDWSASDWISDLIPHLVYGVVTGWVLNNFDAS